MFQFPFNIIYTNIILLHSLYIYKSFPIFIVIDLMISILVSIFNKIFQKQIN